MFKDGREARVAYPTEGFSGDVAGRSFHNGRFVQRLRAAAAAVPAVTVRQATVRSLVGRDGAPWQEGRGPVAGVAYKHTGGGVTSTADAPARVARAHLTVVCDGMYSNLRAKLSTPSIATPSYFVGLVLEGAQLPAPSHGHVVLMAPSPVLFYPISSTEVRCLVDVPGASLPSASTGALAAYLLDVVAPQVPEALRAPFESAVKRGGVRSMQNKILPAKPLHIPGALLLGDSFNMRHPLTGGGMTVALSDAALLTKMLSALPDFADPAATALATAGFYTARKPLSATINTLANALYAVFVARPDAPAHDAMRGACFDYLARGGWYARGPISLLSGLAPKPSVLVAHFFAVAVYGVGRLLLPRPTLKGVRLAVALLATACGIILPIIRAEGVRAVFFPYLAPTPRVDRALLEATFASDDDEKEGKKGVRAAAAVVAN
jgi:squalene monooxygenase